MATKSNVRIAALAVLALVFLLSGGCTARHAYNVGEDFALRKQYDEAVASYSKAVTKDPDSIKYRTKLVEVRNQAALSHLAEGRKLLAAGKRAEALAEFRKATAYDPSVEIAGQEAKRVENLLRAEQLVTEGEGFYRNRRFAQARASVDQALNLDPDNAAALALRENIRQGNKTIVDGIELEVSSTQPINLKFKQTGIKDAFNILSKLSGINFILDDEIKAQTNVNLLLENATFPQALELILQLNKLGKKVLNSKTIIIYPRTKDKDKQFDDYVIQTFYLSNIDAKKAVNLLRTMLQLRKIYVHEELNALVIRDTPEVLKLCTQILESADRANAEVVFDIELYSANASDTVDFGAKLSTSYSSNFMLAPGGTALDTITGTSTTATAKVLPTVLMAGTKNLDNLKFIYTLPTGSATVNLQEILSNAEILANPKLRVKNKEKANVLVGTKEPIITVTTSGTDTKQDNITYVDVGVKVDVEADVQLDDTVVVKLKLEVSSAQQLDKTPSGSIPVRINTTNAQTVLTLKDGEQTIIGGLVSVEDTKSRTGFPILSRIPIIGHLLAGNNKVDNKREIIMSITPHIVKKLDMPLADVATIWSGGEEDLKAGPAFGTFAGSFDPQTDNLPTATAPALGNAAASPAAAAPASATPAALPAAPSPAADATAPAGTLPPAETAVPPETPAAAPAAAQTSAEAAAPASAATANETASVPGAAPAVATAPPAETTAPAASVEEAPAASQPLVELPPLVVPPAGDGTLSIVVPGGVKAGETFPVEVSIVGANALFSAPLFVNFDPALLKFVRGEEGDLLKRGGVATVFAISPMPNQGQLIVGYKQGVGSAGASGDGLLFRLYFSAVAPGSAAVKLERINFRNPAGTRLKVEPAAASVEIR